LTRPDPCGLRLDHKRPGGRGEITDARGKAGPFKSADDLRQALKLGAAAFEKIRYLLKYRD